MLPGMQSAFVDIGLERDAFLYVSDFFEDNEEYDKIVTSVEDKVLKLATPAPPAVPLAVLAPPAVEESAAMRGDSPLGRESAAARPGCSPGPGWSGRTTGSPAGRCATGCGASG